MPRDKARDYDVGYGKPPLHSRFKKSFSGNPRGRPSGSKNISTLVREALDEPVIVTEEGGRRKITKRQAVVTQLVNRSAKADLRALKILLDMLRDIEGQTEPVASGAAELTEADEKVIEQLRARFSTPQTE
jgi:Family of unknown function (DUF5681)